MAYIIKLIAGFLRRFFSQSLHLRRRLVLHFIALLAFLLTATFVSLSSFGLLANTESRIKNILGSYLGEFSASVEEQYDNAAAQAIMLSKNLGAALDRELSESGYTVAGIADNPPAIVRMENTVLPLLVDSLAKAPVSGVFFAMDVTVNSSAVQSELSKSGLYIKIANVNTANPVSPELLMFRGSSDVARQNGMILHNKWELEFRTDIFPFIEKVKAESGPDLGVGYYASPALELPGTWEAASFVAVPVFGQDGAFCGVCGFEISRIYFEHSHRVNSETLRVASLLALLARRDGDGIVTDSGLESGLYSGYRAHIADSALTARQAGGLTVYTDGDHSFIGVEKPVTLSPLADESGWFAAVMIPKADYDAEAREQTVLTVFFVLLILAVSVLASVLLARCYVRPITEGIEQIKQRGVSGFKATNVPEIDDLIEYLTSLDEEHKSEIKQARVREIAAQNSPAVSAYKTFHENLKTLTVTERTMFNLYMENRKAQEISAQMFISMATVKFHNKNIYAKLGVSSLKELMVYVNMMKGEQHGEKQEAAHGVGTAHPEDC